MRDWSGLVHLLAQRLPEDPEILREFLNALWPQIAGEMLGQRTRVMSVAGSTLVVGVPSFLWQRELCALQSMILFRLEKTLGSRRITQLSFVLNPGLAADSPKKVEASLEEPIPLPNLPVEEIPNPTLRELVEQTASKYLAKKAGA